MQRLRSQGMMSRGLAVLVLLTCGAALASLAQPKPPYKISVVPVPSRYLPKVGNSSKAPPLIQRGISGS